jgi:hypothetical protein
MLGLVWFNVRNAASTRSQRGSLNLVMGLGLTRGGLVPDGLGVVTLAWAKVEGRW